MRIPTFLLTLTLIAAAAGFASGKEPSSIVLKTGTDRVEIAVSGRKFATYVFRDEMIPRPYFKDVNSPGGLQVTRNQPPVAKTDLDDHPTFHPGIWQAFGDLGGADFWRNKALVRQVRFVEEPTAQGSAATFAVENAYESNARTICREICRFTVLLRPAGTLLLWDATFQAGADEFAFGDQEEMGLGVRVATPLAVVKGGRIRNSDGQIDEKQAWGKTADWCEYSGTIEGTRCGIVLMPDPENFRKSWFHARNYGVLVANPFGNKAFTKGPASRIVVKPGDSLRLRYGILVFDEKDGRAIDVTAAYRDFLELIPSRTDAPAKR
jgi:hypothetical protein